MSFAIKIKSDGLSANTKISMVDGDGIAVPLNLVESIDFQMPTGRARGTLRLGFIFGNQMDVDLDIPVDAGSADRLKEIGPALLDLRSALGDVPPGGASGDVPEWLIRLHRAACAAVGVEVTG